MIRRLQIPRVTKQQFTCFINKPSASPVTCTLIRHSSGYKSDLTIEKLHPSSEKNFTKVEDFVDVKSEKFSGFIPMDQVQISNGETEVDIR